PQARPGYPVAALDGGVAVVGGVSVAAVGSLSAQRHLTRVLDGHAHLYRAAEHDLTRRDLDLQYVDGRLTAALYHQRPLGLRPVAGSVLQLQSYSVHPVRQDVAEQVLAIEHDVLLAWAFILRG